MDWFLNPVAWVPIICGIVGGIYLQVRWQKNSLRHMIADKGGRVIDIRVNKTQFGLKNDSYDVLYANSENETVLAHYKNMPFASLRLEKETVVENGYTL